MKKLVALILFLIPVLISATGQNLRRPHQPAVVLNTEPGYVNITEFAVGIGLNPDDPSNPCDKSFVGLTTVNGYQINRNFLAGGGTGILFYEDRVFMPLYLDGRYSFSVSNREISHYVHADAGLLLNFRDLNDETRLFINPGFGIRFTLSPAAAANLSAGIFMQMGPANTYRDTFINFKLGVIIIPYKK